MRVELIAFTAVQIPPRLCEELGFRTQSDAPASQLLVEFAGRTCYRSYSNPGGKSNAEYVRHLVHQKHFSVLEHASFSVYVDGVSRAFTHELVRHRHLSFSQLSQRYVEPDDDPVIPPLFWDAPGETADRAVFLLREFYARSLDMYQEFLREAKNLVDEPEGRRRRKRIREAARAVLPNMTPTALVVTGNLRAWREMLEKRLSPDADAEFQEFARRVLGIGVQLAPDVFSDLVQGNIRPGFRELIRASEELGLYREDGEGS